MTIMVRFYKWAFVKKTYTCRKYKKRIHHERWILFGDPVENVWRNELTSRTVLSFGQNLVYISRGLL